MSILTRLLRWLFRKREAESDTSQKRINLNRYDVTNNEQFKKLLESHTRPQIVRSITLTGTKVTSVPQCIGRFTNLSELNLQKNNIEYIPSSFASLQRLQKLDLSENAFNEFPSVLCSLQALIRLDFNDNSIRSLPTNLLNMEALQIISLKGNTNLRSPPLDVSLKGRNAIFEDLKTREQRQDMWQNWTPFVIGNSHVTRVKSLIEICIDCLLRSKVDYQASGYIPPIMKKFVAERTSKIPDLMKCSQCKKVYTQRQLFLEHKCKC